VRKASVVATPDRAASQPQDRTSEEKTSNIIRTGKSTGSEPSEEGKAQWKNAAWRLEDGQRQEIVPHRTTDSGPGPTKFQTTWCTESGVLLRLYGELLFR